MSKTDPIQILIVWANRQQHWVREIVSIVLQQRRDLTQNELTNVFDHFLVETDMAADDTTEVQKLVPSSSVSDPEGRVQLEVLSQVANVNRLAANQAIQFHPNMTVVYGDNASGKSGYVRILKQLAAVRSAEVVLPNVREIAQNQEPNAKIDYKIDSELKNFVWRGEKGLEPFDRISIFDTKSINVHLNKNMQFEYLPQSLSLFRYVNQTISKINNQLKDHLANNIQSPPEIEYTFAAGSDIAHIVAKLDHSTEIQRLISLANFSQDEEDTVERLTNRISALKSSNSSSNLEVARNDSNTYDLLLDFADVVINFDWKKYTTLRQRISTAEKDLKTLAKTETQDSSADDAVSEHWAHFIQSGQAYLDALGRDDYPVAGDRCIYCRQELGADALDLLVRYREHLRNPIRVELVKAQTQLAALISPISNIQTNTLINRIQTKIEASGQSANEALKKGLTLTKSVEGILPKMKSGSHVATSDLGSLANSVKRLAHASHTKSSEEVKSLQTVGCEREDEIIRLTSELLPLQDRLALKRVLAEIVQFVEYKRWANHGQELRRKISSIAASVTNQSNRASKNFLTEPFQQSFTRECQLLRAPRVSLAFPGRRGTAARRKSITNEHQLDEILSEGEQKVLALADFLAEVDTRQSSAPILFDDPVNSLDHKRIEHIADRLHQLSEKHQVIVFTHNIWFASSLIGKFEHDRSKRTIYRLHSDIQNGSGIVSTRNRDVADRRPDYTNQIEKLIAQSDKTSAGSREPIIANAYSYIRSWCEVVAEEELLCNVFRRHHPNAMMTRLVDIKSEKLPEAIRVFSDVHNKACRATEAHSSTMESYGFDVPPLEELKEDWQRIQNARKAYLKDD